MSEIRRLSVELYEIYAGDLRLAISTIEDLADQQAMPDNFYVERLDILKRRLEILEGYINE